MTPFGEAVIAIILWRVHEGHNRHRVFDGAIARDGLADHWSRILRGQNGESMKAVGLPVCLLEFCHGEPRTAKFGSHNCRNPDYDSTKSRHGFPLPVGGKDFDTGTAPRL
jgi:hypothetical protein